MMVHWRTYELGDLVEFRNGKSIKPGGVGSFPAYGANGVIGHSDSWLYKNALILGRVGAYCGAVEYSSGPFWASDNTIVVEPYPEIVDVGFLYYALRFMKLNHYAGGAAQPLLTQTVLKKIEVSIPPITAQRRIAGILSAYDDLIEVNQRRIAILEEMARRLFDEWFVRFRYPGHEAAPLVETELGSVPEGWEPTVLGALLKLSYGRALKSDQRKPGPVAVFGSSGRVGEHDEAMVRGPGIIVGRKGNVGAIHWSTSDFYPIDTVFFVETLLPLRWVHQLLKRQTFLNSDAAVPGLNREQALRMKVLRPPAPLLTRYAAWGEPLFAEAELLEAQNTRLRAARDLLLPRLISGEIDVGRAEEALARAAE